MSRDILEVTLTLPDGEVLRGSGRNLAETVDQIYNETSSPVGRQHAVWIEPLRTGYAIKAEQRYDGPFRVRFADAAGVAVEATVVSEVRAKKVA